MYFIIVYIYIIVTNTHPNIFSIYNVYQIYFGINNNIFVRLFKFTRNRFPKIGRIDLLDTLKTI